MGVGDRLALRGLADQDFIIAGKGYDGGCGPVTLAVLDDPGLAALHNRHTRVGGAEVNIV